MLELHLPDAAGVLPVERVVVFVVGEVFHLGGYLHYIGGRIFAHLHKVKLANFVFQEKIIVVLVPEDTFNPRPRMSEIFQDIFLFLGAGFYPVDA